MSAAQRLFLVIIGLSIIAGWGCRQGGAPPKESRPGLAAKPDPPPPPLPHPGKAARIHHAGQTYDTYTLRYPAEDIQLFWKDDRGNKLKSIDSLKAYVARKGQRLTFATNAGMYTENFSPLGLYIEEGKVLRRLNTVQKAYGNFYLQPNGIFLLTAKRAMVLPTSEYGNVREKVIAATQSGPMLVINGRLHPTFTAGSQNGNIRSGAGIDSAGRVVFAISNGLSNYYDFATLFRDVLHCPNALFLDGAICRMYLPALQRYEQGGAFGAMIGTTATNQE